MRLPLESKRILVTRPKHQAGRLAADLLAKGAKPIVLPTTEIAEPENYCPLDCALGRLNEFDWVIFTSVNGVDAVARRMKTLEIPSERLTSRKLAVVGAMTAEALASVWREPDAVPEEFIASSIADTLGNLPGQRILLARGDLARPELPDELAARGATVLDVTAYRIVRMSERIELCEKERPDAITMTSGESARATIARLRDCGFENWLREAPIVCIGPVTASVVKDEGFSPTIVAKTHTIAGLVEALEELFALRKARA